MNESIRSLDEYRAGARTELRRIADPTYTLETARAEIKAERGGGEPKSSSLRTAEVGVSHSVRPSYRGTA